MMRCWTSGMLRRLQARGSGLRWSSSAKDSAASKTSSAETLETAAKSGMLRMRKAGARKDVEVDTTIARIIGSDWGDRSNQSVSLPMRLYWVVFAVVLGNGVYTYFAGHDEAYLVDKIQKKVDEKLGVVETNEFVVMADKTDSSLASKAQAPAIPAPVEAAKPAAVATAKPSASTPPAKPVSMLSSKPAPTTMPFMSPMARQTARTPQSKEELQVRLQQLRLKQAQLEKALLMATAAHVVEHFEHEIRMIEEQKAQTKRMLRKLK